MTINHNVTLFHSTQICSTGGLTLLEEQGADCRLHMLYMKMDTKLVAAQAQQ